MSHISIWHPKQHTKGIPWPTTTTTGRPAVRKNTLLNFYWFAIPLYNDPPTPPSLGQEQQILTTTTSALPNWTDNSLQSDRNPRVCYIVHHKYCSSHSSSFFSCSSVFLSLAGDHEDEQHHNYTNKLNVRQCPRAVPVLHWRNWEWDENLWQTFIKLILTLLFPGQLDRPCLVQWLLRVAGRSFAGAPSLLFFSSITHHFRNTALYTIYTYICVPFPCHGANIQPSLRSSLAQWLKRNKMKSMVHTIAYSELNSLELCPFFFSNYPVHPSVRWGRTIVS